MEYVKIEGQFPKFSHCAVTLGKFDGIHRGHRKLIQTILNRKKEYGELAVVMAFVSDRQTILTSEERRILLEKMGVDILLEQQHRLMECIVVDAGLNAHLMHHVQGILCGNITGCAGGEGTAAQAAGRFDDEIVPVMVKVKKDMVPFAKDEYPKAGVTAESIAKLKGAFPLSAESPNPVVVNTFEPTGYQDAADKGTQRVTAANASGINDGAAAMVLASGEAVEKYGLKPMAKLIGWGQGGVDPKIMGVGPVVAVRNAMKKAGVTIDDIDLIEANEAFAAQSIAVARELHFDMSKVNVNGGAIALGHPVGASGARIIVTLLHEMQKRPEAKKGLATLCIGGGMGTAVVFEKC